MLLARNEIFFSTLNIENSIIKEREFYEQKRSANSRYT